MGILAVLLNGITVYEGLTALTLSYEKAKSSSLHVFNNKVLVCLIGCGDFLTGVYLVGLSVYDTEYGEQFCRSQAEWLTGTVCSVLGIISTVGLQISVFSMTALSVIRLVGVSWGAMNFPRRISRNVMTSTSSMILGIITCSLVLATTPLIPHLEDYFVQGIYYDPDYRLFVGFPNKERHVRVLQAHYNTTDITMDMTWGEIDEKVNGMFSQQYGTISRKPVHFYGNDGVCLFKYFVLRNDARRSRLSDKMAADITDQKGDAVMWFILIFNLACFTVMTVSYIVLYIVRRRSSSRLGQDHSGKAISQNRKLQRRISIILMTDFVCLVPFIIICGLHNLEYIDATEWYVFIAMIALPLNSVINPLIYGYSIKSFFDKMKDLWKSVRSSRYALTMIELWQARMMNITKAETKSEEKPGSSRICNNETIKLNDLTNFVDQIAISSPESASVDSVVREKEKASQSDIQTTSKE
jgi:hypothetical protein